jgi:putative flippase GtrA
MLTFYKANIAAIIASVVDYSITIGAVFFFNMDAVVAALLGIIGGGVINFLTGRYWAFKPKQQNVYDQGARYLLIWTGYLLLSTGAMYLFTRYSVVHYSIAKLTTSLLLAWGYNYPLQKNYVFKNN